MKQVMELRRKRKKNSCQTIYRADYTILHGANILSQQGRLAFAQCVLYTLWTS